MPRFSVAFSRRKSAATAEDFENVQVNAPESSSFRVIERSEVNGGKSFDGGIRLARATGHPLPRPNTMVDLSMEDNMFADLKGNRGSGASNSTKATSTDTSSRHSNASTAPSSADHGHEDHRAHGRKPLHDATNRAANKSGSGFLSRAGRTFSFGGQKKHSVPPPADNDPLPDLPPVPVSHQQQAPSVPSIQREDEFGRARGMTASTTSTATPPRLEKTNIDLGGDFGSMFSGFDKRASMATLKNDASHQQPRSLTGNRPSHPAPLNLDLKTTVEPSPHSWNSQTSNDNLLASAASPPAHQKPPPVPPHQTPKAAQPAPPKPPLPHKSSSDEPEVDEDVRLLQDSLAATKFLGHPPEDTLAPLNRKPYGSSSRNDEDNMFTGTTSQFSRAANSRNKQAASQSQSKVMTPAEFERYRKDRERQDTMQQVSGKSPSNDDDEDEINYDDDEDDMEKSKQQAKQRRKQEAHMAVYRQQMMKVTGENAPSPPPSSNRPNLPTSLSAPHLNHLPHFKTPSPDPMGASDEDDDEEVPLAILQAHGFPNKNRPPARLSTMGSNPNLRSSMMPPARPGSAMGEATANSRHSNLPAFARHLPQDPFVGASISRPAVRESLALGGGSPAMTPGAMPGPQQGPIPPGGLVGVIASEERSRAMRRGSPNIENQRGLIGNLGLNASDPLAGIPSHMMYGMGGQGGMMQPQMGQQPMLTPGDQAQIQMTQQMQQFMQMQMQFMQMQMMAANQNATGSPMMQQPPFGMPVGNQSLTDLSSRQSMLAVDQQHQHLAEPRRMDAGMRTMSMVQPSSASFLPHPGYAGSIRAPVLPAGYTPSIAPSERSNIGLPGRYRPVSQAPSQMPVQHQRSNTMSGALSLSRWDENKPKSTINVVTKAGEASDDDEEEGWEAMKAKREKKKSSWKNKKLFGSDLSTMIS
ncbi:hypothetical protein B0I35DRAFT_139664 [Stachybotrys elegans]|uniref:Uncharacterized protein n=1 Tax=Stachybotrys elegans TaxID=80388 RepID=A0A8K0T5N5_9HYPO|nr:hypothetical protein B0I35DRAFT_139664 [Stachybotrys elegans]